MSKIKHVLGLSGGKDSAALALYMCETRPDIEFEYFFTDTGKELPEVYSFINELEARLGTTIHKLNQLSLNGITGRGEKDFDYWLKEHNNFLPSQRDRWCTVKLKLEPFEKWVNDFIEDGYEIYNYVGIRADEATREGYQIKDKPITTITPFKEDGIIRSDIETILNRNGISLPAYYEWRSRSGCTFCFYQKKIEWLRLIERHPDKFEDAKKYEKNKDNNTVGETFYWLGKGTPLETLEDPKVAERIRSNHDKAVLRFKKKLRRNALIEEDIIDTKFIDDIYDDVEGGGACIVCYK